MRRLGLVAVVRGLSAVSPVKYWALRYRYVDGMLEKRGPYRAAHLEGLQQLGSKVALGGAFNDPCDGAVILFDASCTKDEISDFASSDPYVVNGLVSEWSVSEYMAVVGDLKPNGAAS